MPKNIFEEMGFEPNQPCVPEEALYNLARSYAFLNQGFQRCYAPFGLTPAKMNLLMLIKHRGGQEGISQTEIAQRLIVSGADVTGLIDRLEREGMLTRTCAKKDRRVNLIKITAKGSALLDQVWPEHVKHAQRAAGGLSAKEQKALVKLLSKLRHNLPGAVLEQRP